MQDLLVFLHVEKAGGTSLNRMLHHFIPGYISPRDDFGETFTSSDLKIIQRFYPLKIAGIGGHRISSLENYSKNQFLFSFVREPLGRFISHLNWHINKMNVSWNLGSFLEEDYFNNFQTYRLTRKRSYSEAKEILLNRFDFVGLVEEFDLSTNILSSIFFGDSALLKYEKLNITSNSDKKYKLQSLSEKEQKELVRRNQIDIDIYNFIKYDIFEPFKENFGEISSFPGTLNTPISSLLKMKLSTAYIGRMLQPAFQKRVKYGY